LPERGLLMGNRGCLHDRHRRVVKGNPQHVDRREVEAVLQRIRTGQAPGWVAVA